MEGKKERLSNFELMRLISMFLIVLWHTTLHSTLYTNAYGFLKFLLDVIMCFCLVHVNSLVLVTGYFQCNKKTVSTGKVFKVLGTAWFYKVLFLILFLFFGTISISKVKIFQELMPIDYNNYWFINNYIVLFLISPFLNRIVNYCSQKELKHFLLILFTTLSVIPAITNHATIQNNGFGVIHFIFIYFVGAYLRKYPIRLSYHFKNTPTSKYRFLIVCSFITLGILNFVLYNFGDVLRRYNIPLLNYFGGILQGQFLVYSSPIPVLMSILYFLFFETLTLKSKCINHFAATTFGIYLIHDNAFVRGFIYKFLKVEETIMNTSPIKGVIALLGFATILYVGCVVIEEVRIILENIRKGIWKRPKKKKPAPAFLYLEETKPKKEILPKEEKPKKNKEEENPESFIDF